MIIGAGFSGLGVAQALNRKGIRSAVLEKQKITGATSKNSLRIVHGGLRYLQSFNLIRVQRSAAAQARLITEYSQFVKPLACLMPLNKHGLKSPIPLRIASKLYSYLAKRVNYSPPPGKIINAHQLNGSVNLKSPSGKFFAWYDALVTDLKGISEELRAEIEKSESKVFENCEVEKVRVTDSDFEIKTSSKIFNAKVLVNATGPWLDEVRKRVGIVSDTETYPEDWCKAFNLIVNKKLVREYAVGVESESGRLYFATPRGEQTALGTWYLPFAGDNEEVTVFDHEMKEALIEYNTAFPAAKLKISDICEVEVGVLPCKKSTGADPVLYGTEKILAYERYIEVLSTKFTTFQLQGEEVAKLCQKELKRRGQ